MKNKLKIIGAKPYKGSIRDICNNVKLPEKDWTKDTIYAIASLAEMLPQKSLLIPVPGHCMNGGVALTICRKMNEYATYDNKTCEVFDCISGAVRPSLCELKRSGTDPFSDEYQKLDLGFTFADKVYPKMLKYYIENGYAPFIVDNVVDTGKTVIDMIKALGRNIPVLAIGKTGLHTGRPDFKHPGKVTVDCYGKKHTVDTVRQAEDFFWNCVENSEGAERDRYINILLQLRRGETCCSDQDS